MKFVSAFDKPFHCETPNSDSHRCFPGVTAMLEFLKENDAGEIKYDDEFGVWRVPAWSVGRQKYSEMKQRHCDRYGCE